jgi:mono/diheme cytochrome c family protein
VNEQLVPIKLLDTMPVKRCLTALVAAMLLAGCAGGKHASVTSAQFVAARDTACSRLPEPLNRIPIGGAGGTLVVDTVGVADRVDRFIASIQRLDLPRGRELPAAKAFLASIDHLAPAISAVRVAAEGVAATRPTDTAAVSLAIAHLGAAFTRFERLVVAAAHVAATNGLKQCGESLGIPAIANETMTTGSLTHVLPPRTDSPAQAAEFRNGRAVAAESGCLACHKIAGNGSAGPGPDLSAIGTRLPSFAIARELRNPVAPMPSYRALTTSKFDALVAFLAGLHGDTP